MEMVTNLKGFSYLGGGRRRGSVLKLIEETSFNSPSFNDELGITMAEMSD